MEKADWFDSFHTAAKALISIVPFFGGIMGSIYGDVLGEIKENRLKDFINSIKKEVDENTERMNKEFINNVEFLDLFEITAKRIVDERSEKKRLGYKNILLKGVFSSGHTYDETEAQLKILDQLTDSHLILLSLFFNPQVFSKNIDLTRHFGNTYLSLLKIILPGWDYDFLVDHLIDLENLRLIDKISDSLRVVLTKVQLNMLEGKLTSRGMSFVVFILGDPT